MKKEISTIILLAILIIAVMNLASAEVVYSGENYSFESEEFEYYIVVGNSSNMEGMSILWDNEYTTISFVSNFAPDSFTLVFFNQEKEIITEHHYSSSGGETIYVDKEVLVEVPNYIDREVEVIKEIPSEPEIIKEVPIWSWILLGFLVLSIFFLLWFGTRG